MKASKKSLFSSSVRADSSSDHDLIAQAGRDVEIAIRGSYWYCECGRTYAEYPGKCQCGASGYFDWNERH